MFILRFFRIIIYVNFGKSIDHIALEVVDKWLNIQLLNYIERTYKFSINDKRIPLVYKKTNKTRIAQTRM